MWCVHILYKSVCFSASYCSSKDLDEKCQLAWKLAIVKVKRSAGLSQLSSPHSKGPDLPCWADKSSVAPPEGEALYIGWLSRDVSAVAVVGSLGRTDSHAPSSYSEPV